jgi:hypothetical protein
MATNIRVFSPEFMHVGILHEKFTHASSAHCEDVPFALREVLRTKAHTRLKARLAVGYSSAGAHIFLEVLAQTCDDTIGDWLNFGRSLTLENSKIEVLLEFEPYISAAFASQ